MKNNSFVRVYAYASCNPLSSICTHVYNRINLIYYNAHKIRKNNFIYLQAFVNNTHTKCVTSVHTIVNYCNVHVNTYLIYLLMCWSTGRWFMILIMEWNEWRWRPAGVIEFVINNTRCLEILARNWNKTGVDIVSVESFYTNTIEFKTSKIVLQESEDNCISKSICIEVIVVVR